MFTPHHHFRLPFGMLGFLLLTIAGLASAQSDRDPPIGVLPRPPLIAAAMQGDLNAVKVRLAQGDAVDLRDEFGATPLLAAVWAGQTDVARFLLGRGANVNADSLGNTPLLGAAVHDPDGTLTALLLRAGAKIGHENKEGENDLTLAARSGRVPVLTLLAEKGAKVNERTSKGMTPLVTAAACGQESAVAALLDAGAEINLPTRAGETALMAAASNWRTEVARLLLERGADRTIKNAEGRTALDLARNLKRPDIVALLEKVPVSTANQPGPKPEGPAPQLVRSNIDDNDMAVDPALTELVWTFDQPMNQRRYHLIPSAQKKLGRLPEFVGEDPTFFRDERTFVLRVKLEPNTRYAIGLNDDQRLEFRSVRGVPLEPLIYYFRTGATADVKKPTPTVPPKSEPDLNALYRKVLEKPTRENYLAAYGALILHPKYSFYALSDMERVAGAKTEKECREVLALMGSPPVNLILSPRAHGFTGLAAKKLGDEVRSQAEMNAMRKLLTAIVATGDGSEQNPYIITRLSDQDDVLMHLDKEKVSRYSASGARGFCDVYRCKDGSSVWFKIPPTR